MGLPLPPRRFALSIAIAATFFVLLIWLVTSSHPISEVARARTKDYFKTSSIGSISLNNAEDDRAHLNSPTASSHKPTWRIFKPTATSFSKQLEAFFGPYLIPVTSQDFVSPLTGEEYRIEHSLVWTKPLGKKLCIVDIDTRPLDQNGQFNHPQFVWEKLDEGISAGMFNHFLYAQIHGYDYHFIHTTAFTPSEDRSNYWTKIPALASILPHYDIVVMLDADALFMHLALPYEYLLNRWNFTLNTSLALPMDTGTWTNGEKIGYAYNSHGDLNPNAGFITVQNLPRTYDILAAWHSCPDDEARYPGCTRFRKDWPAEQGGLGEYIRYEFDLPTDILTYDCSDGNGFPWQGTDCIGRFVRHFTTSKAQVKSGVAEIVMQSLMGMAKHEFLDGDVKIERLSNLFTEDIEGTKPVPIRRPRPLHHTVVDNGISNADTRDEVDVDVAIHNGSRREFLSSHTPTISLSSLSLPYGATREEHGQVDGPRKQSKH